jgi:hypothetical protein
MDYVHLYSLVRRALLSVTLVVVFSACHKWVEVAPPDIALQEQADKPVQDREALRLHIRDTGAKFDGDPVQIGPDSVVLAKDQRRIPILTEDVSKVEVRRGDALGIGGVGLLAAAGLFGVLLLAVASTFD